MRRLYYKPASHGNVECSRKTMGAMSRRSVRVAITRAFTGIDPSYLVDEEVCVGREAEPYLAGVGERLAREGISVDRCLVADC